MQDLNNLLADAAPGWTLQSAEDISNAGHIVGYGLNAQGRAEAFLLTPIVPEPSSLMALAGGLLALGGVIRRRR